MNGFSDNVFNHSIADIILSDVIEKVLVCCRIMVKDYINKNEQIKNHEEVIRNILLYDYLNDNDVRRDVGLDQFYFISESPESYVDGLFKRRADLKVINAQTLKDTEKYFIFECKRIDGTRSLNKDYVKEGIDRFINESQPIYPSPYKRNCMLGFIVKDIEVYKNVEEINKLQCELKIETKEKNRIVPVKNNTGFSFIYQSFYDMKKSEIKLYHLFHQFFEVIE